MASANVLELLDCSICMESMLPPIYQCQNGHTLCKTCKETIQKQQKDVCPTCRIPLGNIRCLALERMADNIKVPCQYTGCEDMFEYVLRLDHAKKCKFRPYSCPYVASACNVTGDVIEIIDHLKTDHKLDVLDTNSIDVEFENPNPSADDNKICKLSVFKCFGHYFLLHFESFEYKTAPVYMAFLRFLGEVEEAKEYTYNLEVGRFGRKQIWQGVPRSIRDSHTDVRNSLDGLMIQKHLALFFSGSRDKVKLHMVGAIWKD